MFIWASFKVLFDDYIYICVGVCLKVFKNAKKRNVDFSRSDLIDSCFMFKLVSWFLSVRDAVNKFPDFLYRHLKLS